MALGYPIYYRLIEHEKLITVIKVDNLKGEMDVKLTVATACTKCPHFLLPGECLVIEKTDVKEWMVAHA